MWLRLIFMRGHQWNRIFIPSIYPSNISNVGARCIPEGLDTTTWYYSLLPGYHRRASWVRWGQLIDCFVDAELATQKYSLLILVIISNYNPIPLECSSNIILRHAQKPAQDQCFGISQTTNLKPSMFLIGGMDSYTMTHSSYNIPLKFANSYIPIYIYIYDIWL